MKHTITIEIDKRVNPAVVGGYWMLLKDTAEDGTVAWYRASAIPFAFDTRGPETLVFPSDEEGDIVSWTDVVGIPEMNFDKAISALKAVLEGRQEYDVFDTPAYQIAGDPLSYMVNTFKGMADRAMAPPVDGWDEDEHPFPGEEDR